MLAMVAVKAVTVTRNELSTIPRIKRDEVFQREVVGISDVFVSYQANSMLAGS